MAINRILFSFILALLINGIVAVGAMSFFYWINNNSNNQFVIAHRRVLTLVISFAYLSYLFLESLNNTYFDHSQFGYHWTFLNMIILALYFLIMQEVRLSQVLLETVLVAAYYVLFTTQFTVLGVSACLCTIALMFCAYRNARRILRRRVLNYGMLAALGAAATTMVYQMGNYGGLDAWFWARQIGGLAIVGIVMLEYSYAMGDVIKHAERVKEQATIDGLTGLLNYSSFTNDLMQHFAAYKQGDIGEYSVFEVDLDLFKRINDTYDHLTGNEVLRAIADELTGWAAETTEGATAYRLGGEEFALIVDAEISTQRARAIAKDFQRRLARLRFGDIDADIRLTCSIGQARVLPDDYTHHDVYKAADKNLYMSKRSGRNLISLAPDAD